MATAGRMKTTRNCVGLWTGCVLTAALVGSTPRLIADEPAAVTEADQLKEVWQLYGAAVAFQEKFTALPPSAAGEERIKRFVRKAFPQARAGAVPPLTPDAAEVLPYWLCKLSTDPRRPFADVAKEARQVFFEFAEKRLKDGR